MRLGTVLLAGLLAGCASGSGVDDRRVARLGVPDPDRREEAFQDLLRVEGAPAPALRAALGLGASHGFPAVALLYAQGRGDAVPLELKARHLASFEWPKDLVDENAVVEPYVRYRIEQDVVRVGAPALPVLARVLEEETEGEAGELRIAGLMLRIGGRAAAREFARLLDSERVADTAASALLYMGCQEAALRLASAAARIEAARTWWDLGADFPESEWIRDAVDGLAPRFQGKDPEGVRPVLELLTGRTLEDPRAWWEQNRGWRPEPPPLRPEELLPRLSQGRSRAYDANRRLEEATGLRVWLPRMNRRSELRAALRLWEPPEDLELRWHRTLESPLLRLSVAAIGVSPRQPHRIRWSYEGYFHPVEDESGELRIETRAEGYGLFVQALDLGTRLVASESHGVAGAWTGTVREFRAGRPMLLFSSAFKAALVAVVEEVPARRPPPPPAMLQAEWRERLSELRDSPDALRALAYFQNPYDLALMRERRAGAALLILGDPAGLDLHPELEPHEVDMGLQKADDPRVRRYLEELRRRN
ncbi:MAG TPA: hypothetical protein VE981_11565 [Planctomycetota bacterium]|nr:hypothetical protein [Planctomycetota bacterium]